MDNRTRAIASEREDISFGEAQLKFSTEVYSMKLERLIPILTWLSVISWIA